MSKKILHGRDVAVNSGGAHGFRVPTEDEADTPYAENLYLAGSGPEWGASMLARIASASARALRSILVNELGACESPIEELFLIALCTTWEINARHDATLPLEACRAIGFEPQAALSAGRWDVIVQEKIGRHRVDFAMVTATPGGKLLALVVECDGHDFHEKTKEQARKDKARDRDLQRAGYRVMRFTGSELFADPFACVMQLESFAAAESARLDG